MSPGATLDRPRFTIRQLMIVVALCATYLGLIRVMPGLSMTLLGISCAGVCLWIGMKAINRWPKFFPGLVVVSYLALAVSALGVGQTRSIDLWLLFVLLILGMQPILFGGFYAWLRHLALFPEVARPITKFLIALAIVLPSSIFIVATLVLSYLVLLGDL